MTPPTPTKKLFTLVLIHDRPNSRVLLGRKKRGIGQGNFNGFGGKIEKDKDADVASSALRELREEAGVAPDARGLSRRGVLSFHFLDTPSEVWETHLFTGEGLLSGEEPRETDEMEPQWFNIQKVPYDQMWQDDKYWLPSVLGCDGDGEGEEQKRKNVIGEFWVRSFFFVSLLSAVEVERSERIKQTNSLTFVSLFLLQKNKQTKQFESSSGPGSKIMTKHELKVVEGEECLPPLPTW